jgi:hypothetical protein
MSIKNSNDTIGNRTCDTQACSAVWPPRTPTQNTVMAPKSRLHCSILLYRSIVLNFTQEQATKASGGRGDRYSSTLSLTLALDGGGWSTPAPALYPPEITRCLLYRTLDGPQGWAGQVRKISDPTDIRSPARPAQLYCSKR